MELDILIRGQSNAFLLVSDDLGGVGRSTLQAEVQRLLGFDGTNDQVHLIFDSQTPGAQTVQGATAFIGDWMQQGPNGWQPVAGEEALLNHVRLNPHPGAASTAVLWLHNEFDSLRDDLTPAEWTGAVRAEAALLRQALGRDAADSPYVFVSAIPYLGGSDAGHQAIRLGMEELAADPGFNAGIGARALDLDMSYKFPGEWPEPVFGATHISAADAVTIANRAALAIAEEWAEYARPGSPVAMAGGDIADAGPQVVGATLTAPDTLRLTVAQDGSAGFAALDPEAAAGTGWTARSGSTVVAADSARIIAGDTLELHFGASLPAGATLHYGWGYGRLAGYNQPGQGNAIYDQAGLPIWTPAAGVAITGTATPSPTPTPPSGGSIDWNAVAAAVTAYHATTGIWYAGDPTDLLNQPAPTPTPTPTPTPAPTPPPASGGSIDWNAVAAAVTAYHAATGIWWAGDPAELLNQTPAPPPPPAPSGPVDWNALAAQVTANFEATGGWFG